MSFIEDLHIGDVVHADGRCAQGDWLVYSEEEYVSEVVGQGYRLIKIDDDERRRRAAFLPLDKLSMYHRKTP